MGFFSVLCSTLLHLPPLCFSCVGGLLRPRHWLSDALATRLNLIHKSARSHPHSARSHPQIGYISSIRKDLIHIRLDLITFLYSFKTYRTIQKWTYKYGRKDQWRLETTLQKGPILNHPGRRKDQLLDLNILYTYTCKGLRTMSACLETSLPGKEPMTYDLNPLRREKYCPKTSY